MNAALFMLTSAWMAGADVAVAPAPAPAPTAPAVVSTGSSCGGGCSTACEDPCGKVGFFTKLKAKMSFGHKCAEPCATPCTTPAPVIYKPAPIVHAPVTTCDTCTDPCKHSLFSRLKGGFHKSSCGCDAGCGTSACAGATVTTPGVAPVHPEVIPPPKKTDKEMPKGGTTGITIEPILTPVVAPKPIDLNGQKNPF